MGKPRALALLLLIDGLLALADPGVGGPTPSDPLATPPYDLGPWHVGDRWTYSIHLVSATPGGVTMDARLDVTHTVAGVELVTVFGRTYSSYNSTVSGGMTARGTITLGGTPYDYELTNGTVGGYLLTDRSNLALVAENQTVDARGRIRVLAFDYLFIVNATTTTRHGPAQEVYDFPLELGDTWSYRGIANTTGGVTYRVPAVGLQGGEDLSGETTIDLRSWFNGTESANVPAGAFPDSARIHTATRDGTADAWYHPDVRSFVRMESHSVRGPNDYAHVWTNLTEYALGSPSPWPGSLALTPARVNPGGWLTARGVANPGEALVVSVPATGASYGVVADGSGAWSLAFRAPLADDDTPANADNGSHGVLVQPAASPTGWNVTTLQLILPDLRVDPAEFLLSDPTPSVGVRIDVNATLRIGPAVDVRSTFDVTFAVDGVVVHRETLANRSAGGVLVLGASWTPTAGLHTIALTADANGEVPESDEGNNTASRTVLVRGPDLVPWNITVESEGVDTYVDPAVTAFRSQPAQGRLGGVVNVSFDIANAGGTDAPDGFVVRLVETLGPFGPPAGAPVYEAVSVVGIPAGSTVGRWTALWSVPPNPGVYYLNLTADATDLLSEESEGNNTFAILVNVSGPDYRVESVSAPPKVTAGSSHGIDVRVRNDGELAGDRDVLVALYEGAAPLPVATATVPPLAASGAVTVSLSWTAPSAAAIVSLRAVIDPDDALEEMIESNNEGGATVDVRPPPVTALDVIGRNVTVGGVRFVLGTAVFVLTGLDRSDTGIRTYVAIDGGPPVLYAGPFSLAAEGPHAIEYWSEDNLGGVETARAFAVSVDSTPPESSVTASDQVGNRRTVEIASVDAGAGVARIEYRVNRGPWRDYAGPFELSGPGDYEIEYHAMDRLEQWEDPKATVVTVEPVAVSPSANWKPWLATAFALLLLVAGFRIGRRDPGWSLGSARTVGVVFAAAEFATGALSTVNAGLAIPPLGLGLAVDLAILLAGLAAISLLPRKARREEPPAEPGTDK